MARKKYDKYVYSTLTDNMDYTAYVKGPEGSLPVVESHVHIAGGSNVADGHFNTPRGVVTGVSDGELEALMNNHTFRLHMENGFITVADHDEEPEVVAADMEGRDLAAPLVPEDLGDKDPKVVETNSKNPRKA